MRTREKTRKEKWHETGESIKRELKIWTVSQGARCDHTLTQGSCGSCILWLFDSQEWYTRCRNQDLGWDWTSWRRLRESRKGSKFEDLERFMKILQIRYGIIPVCFYQEGCIREVKHGTAGRLGFPSGVTAVEQCQANGRAEQRVTDHDDRRKMGRCSNHPWSSIYTVDCETCRMDSELSCKKVKWHGRLWNNETYVTWNTHRTQRVEQCC